MTHYTDEPGPVASEPSKLDTLRLLVAELDVIRADAVGKLDPETESHWRMIQGRLENVVREIRRDAK
mgnify:CR=1 FL=1